MIEIVVTAEQPLILGSRPDSGWVGESYRLIPGSVLRGALAAAWIAEHPAGTVPARDPGFRALFEGDIRYSPLYTRPDALRPLSVFGCKYRPLPACRTFVVDAAYTTNVPDECQECRRSPMEAGKGQIDDVDVVERTHVQMHADLDVAADGGLFSRQALPAGTTLAGHIIGTHPWLTAEPERLIRLGGRRSTSGLARATLAAAPAGPATGWDASRGRLVLRLLSPAILVDDAGRPQWRPRDAELSELLGVPVRVAAEWVRPVGVGGWNAAANFPKPRELAVAAGSVYVLDLDGPPDDGACTHLYRTGLGLRRAEGFGWITLDRWTPPPAASASAADRADLPAEDPIISDLHVHGLVGLVHDDVRQRAETGPGPIPDTRRYRDLPAGRRALVERLFAFDADRLRVIADLLDIADREVFR